MFIANLAFNELALAKIDRRGIRRKELMEVRRNRSLVVRNPHPRHPESRLMIGQTDGGRMLTAVIEPDDHDGGIWHVRTAWASSKAERSAYRKRS